MFPLRKFSIANLSTKILSKELLTRRKEARMIPVATLSEEAAESLPSEKRESKIATHKLCPDTSYKLEIIVKFKIEKVFTRLRKFFRVPGPVFHPLRLHKRKKVYRAMLARRSWSWISINWAKLYDKTFDPQILLTKRKCQLFLWPFRTYFFDEAWGETE